MTAPDRDKDFWETMVRALIMVTRAVLVHKLGKRPEDLLITWSTTKKLPLGSEQPKQTAPR